MEGAGRASGEMKPLGPGRRGDSWDAPEGLAELLLGGPTPGIGSDALLGRSGAGHCGATPREARGRGSDGIARCTVSKTLLLSADEGTGSCRGLWEGWMSALFPEPRGLETWFCYLKRKLGVLGCFCPHGTGQWWKGREWSPGQGLAISIPGARLLRGVEEPWRFVPFPL